MGRRARGTGNIREIARAGYTAYQVRWYGVPDPLTGQRPQHSTTLRDKDKAEQYLRDQLSALHHGTHVSPDRITVGELLARWLDEDAAARAADRTLHEYRRQVEKHLMPRVGKTRAQTLSVADVSRLRAELLKATGPRSAQLALLRLRQALAWGVSVDLLRRNVAAKVDLPAYDAPEPRALTHAQAHDFLQIAGADHYWPLWEVFLHTGLRRGEALGLRWQDLDLERRLLSVRQQVVKAPGADGKKRPTIVPTLKTSAAYRTLTLFERTVVELEKHREKQARVKARARHWFEGDLVFCTRHGLALSHDNLYRNFKRIRADAGLDDDWDVHHLRHSHLTHCLLGGMAIELVARRAGHGRTSTTLDVYSHTLPGHEAAALDVIERLLFPDLPELGD